MKADSSVDASTPAFSAEGRQGRVLLLVLAAMQFTNIVDFMIVMPLGSDLMRRLSISPRQFGMIVASYTVSASVAALVAATFIDRFDRKRAFLTLYTGFLAGTFCCGLAPGYVSLLAARVATGAFGGILGGLAMAIIADVFPEERRGAANGVLMSAFAVASVAGVPLGLVLNESFGWHAPFLALAGVGLFVLAAAAAILPSLRGHLENARRADPLAELGSLMTHPEHLKAFGLVVTLMIGGFAVIPYIATYLIENVGVPKGRLSLVYIVSGALTLVASPLIGKLADRHGKFRVYRVIAPISALFMLGLTYLPRAPLGFAVLATALLMVGNAGRMLVAMTMIASCVEPRRRGSFMSLNSAVQHLAAGIGASLAGSIITKDAAGALVHYPTVGWIALVMTLASLAFAARLRPYAAPEVQSDDLPSRTVLDLTELAEA